MAVKDDVWHRVFDRDKGLCAYCNESLLASLLVYRCAEIDHLLPESEPTREDEVNLVLSCRPCNGSLSRAHEQGLFSIEARRKYLEGTNTGFEKRRIQHYKTIYGCDPPK